jgi:hypothetical protein
LRGLFRHFEDLHNGTHGNGAVTRDEKDTLFAAAVNLLDPYARQALIEINDTLLLNTGTITATGFVRLNTGNSLARWSLSWPEQIQRCIEPVTLEAFFGKGFHHPHLRGATVGNWPLNVFDDADAEAELPTLRAIAGADLHNLVFQSDYRIIPAIISPRSKK